MPINGDAALRGWVPWSVVEFLLIHNNAVRLQESTHVSITGHGLKEDLAVAPTALIALALLRNRYPRTVADAHWRRYRLIHAFVDEYEKGLQAAGWIHHGQPSLALLAALSAAEFGKAEYDVAAGMTRYAFDYDEVVLAADLRSAATTRGRRIGTYRALRRRRSHS